MADYSTFETYYLFELFKAKGGVKKRAESRDYEVLAQKVFEKSDPLNDPEITKEYLYNRYRDLANSVKENKSTIGLNPNRIDLILKYLGYVSYDDFREELYEVLQLRDSMDEVEEVIVHYDKSSEIVKLWSLYTENIKFEPIKLQMFNEQRKSEKYGFTALLVKENAIVVHVVSEPLVDLEHVYVEQLKQQNVIFVNEHEEAKVKNGISARKFILLLIVLTNRAHVSLNAPASDFAGSINIQSNSGTIVINGDIQGTNQASRDFHQNNYYRSKD